MDNKYEVKFQYADSYSGYKWRNQSCTVYAPDEQAARNKCISLYGLADGDCDYKILSVEKIK